MFPIDPNNRPGRSVAASILPVVPDEQIFAEANPNLDLTEISLLVRQKAGSKADQSVDSNSSDGGGRDTILGRTYGGVPRLRVPGLIEEKSDENEDDPAMNVNIVSPPGVGNHEEHRGVKREASVGGATERATKFPRDILRDNDTAMDFTPTLHTPTILAPMAMGGFGGSVGYGPFPMPPQRPSTPPTPRQGPIMGEPQIPPLEFRPLVPGPAAEPSPNPFLQAIPLPLQPAIPPDVGGNAWLWPSSQEHDAEHIPRHPDSSAGGDTKASASETTIGSGFNAGFAKMQLSRARAEVAEDEYECRQWAPRQEGSEVDVDMVSQNLNI